MNKMFTFGAATVLLFWCFLNLSCSKGVTDPVVDPPVGAHANDADRSIPYNNADWMANIDDNKYLSEISIPGTHDAGADLHTSEQGVMSKFVIAQDFRISNQLLLGVRWFDIRLNDDEGTCTLYHGSYYLHKNFNDIIRPALAFLTDNPTETLIFMIKQENSSRGDDAFANSVLGYLNWSYPDRFWMGDHIPQLKEVRGKIVIVRQFWGTHGYAMGVPLIWSSNTTGSFGNSDNGTYVYVQDHYSLNKVASSIKIAEIEDCITKAHNEPYPYRCYYLNFTSGERDVDGFSLEAVAAEINPKINDFLISKNWHNVGVIFVNFAGGSDNGVVSPDLVNTIVKMNDFNIPTIKIGTQVWMKSNLNVTKYRNGDPIQNVTDATAWSNLTTGAYCNYHNDVSHSVTDGKLYNWYAVDDSRGLAPAGFHVASYNEWSTLIDYLGGADVAGGKLKEAGTNHWNSPNTGANNETGFTAYPGGWREASGVFNGVNEAGAWWTSFLYNGVFSFDFIISSNSSSVSYEKTSNKCGYTVRCIKD